MDNKNIFNRVKMKIAISKLEEEDIVMNKNILKNVVITMCALMATTGVVFGAATIINKFGPNASEGSKKAIENGYIAYSKEDSIVDSFMLDNYNFYIAFKEEKLGLTLDEIDKRFNDWEKQKEYLTIKNENNEFVFTNITNAYGLTKQDGKIIYTATATEFPKSKELYVDFAGMKEVLYVPENMQGDITRYKLKSISDENWKFESASLSNTAFKIYLNNCDGIVHDEKNRVETSDGKEFYPQARSDGDGCISVNNGIVSYYNTFNLTSFEATDELSVYLYKNDGSEIIIKLLKEE